jgi:hypothetical protein
MGATRSVPILGAARSSEACQHGLRPRSRVPHHRSWSEDRLFDAGPTAGGPIIAETWMIPCGESMLRRGEAQECCEHEIRLTRPQEEQTARRVTKP